jgi:short-subunit dehydrogenase
MDVKNKVAIVTGASSGIGLATAKLLTEKGAKVVLLARSKELLEKLSKELPDSLAVTADMTKIPDIKRMVAQAKKHYGRVDVLVNNAGQGYDSPVEKIDVDAFRRIIDLNVIGPLVAMQEVIPIMRKKGGGAIVNISSGLALMYLADMGVYSASKRALVDIPDCPRRTEER